MNTRLMSRLFSATEEKDEELTEQVGNDIETAKAHGMVDTDELRYENQGDGRVAILDKGNGEITMAERAEDGNYDLYPYFPTKNLEGFIHPEGDGVTPGNLEDYVYEDANSHLEGMPITDYYRYNYERTAGQNGEEIQEEECDDEKNFSVYSDNTAVLRIFADQEFCERVFSEVIESEDTAKVGNLKIEKLEDEDNTVVVTDEASGDQAKVTLDDDEMEVTELDSKNFCGCCGDNDQYESIKIVGVDPQNHVLVNAEAFTDEDVEDLTERLVEQGVDAIQAFDNQEDARDYALNLLENLGVEDEDDIDEPVEVTYSDTTIYYTRFYSNSTEFMDRLFSEEACGECDSKEKIEDAIESGEEIETDDEIITPVDANTAVIEDKESGEFTKAVMDDDKLDINPISEKEADKLTEDLAVEDDEKEYSDIYTDDTETRYFSENEYMTDYMIRLFSDDASTDEEDIADAIESGEEVETDDEIITPVDSKTAVIEDKESGEYTKATLDENDDLDVEAISEDEAEELTKDLAVEDKDDDEDEKEYSDLYTDETETRLFSENEPMTDYMIRLFSDDASTDEEDIAKAIEDGEEIETEDETITPVDANTAVIEDKESGEYTKAILNEKDDVVLEPITEEEANKLTEDLAVEDNDEDEDEKEYSDIYTDDTETRYFSENEYMTEYMIRLFSDEASTNEDDIEDAIESGEEIETDDEIITPIDDTTAIIEDKENGEYTKAVMDDDKLDINPISEDEAEELTKDLVVEDKDDDEDEKEYSEFGDPILDKFFADAVGVPGQQSEPEIIPAVVDPQTGQLVPADQMQQPQDPGMMDPNAPQLSVEAIEDKALAAVNSIQAAAAEAEATIMNAKAAPVEGQEQNLQEAQFSDYYTEDERQFCETEDTLISWLNGNGMY